MWNLSGGIRTEKDILLNLDIEVYISVYLYLSMLLATVLIGISADNHPTTLISILALNPSTLLVTAL